MYWHQAMKSEDNKEFLAAAQKEVDDQASNGIWEIAPRSQVPKGVVPLPAVWAMKRKRRISTGEIYKWKARLNLDGSKQVKGVHYDQTYAPVATWPTIRLVIAKALQLKWYTRQIDFVQAYNQAEAKSDTVYMEIPKGFEVPGAKPGEYVLHVKKNTYGGCDSGRTWNAHLVKRLLSIGFTQSKVDECLFYRGSSLYVLYCDDSILCGPDEAELDSILQEMQDSGLNLTIEGELGDFLGVKIEQKDVKIHLTQPHLIEQILRDVQLDKPNVTTKQTPASTSKVLSRHSDSEDFDQSFESKLPVNLNTRSR
jgi:hypothetical protein